MPYVDQRWLGGMLTNFKTVKGSLKKLKEMQAQVDAGTQPSIKKEALMFQREIAKLEKDIGGIQDMNALPDAMFVIDVGYHKIAVAEAVKLGIPVIGIVDSNHSPLGIDYVIPGNDDSAKAVALYARAIADAVLEGKANATSEVVQAVRPAATSSSRSAKTPDRFARSIRRIAIEGAASRPLFSRQRSDVDMPAITASMVAELRAKTDAPMMECKKALTEADGDAERAEEILRVKLGNKAGKAASRVTAEGVVRPPSAAAPARWSKSTARPTSFRRTNRSWPSRKACAQLVAEHDPADVAALSALAVRAGRLRPDARGRAQGPDRQDRREHVDPPLSSATAAAASWPATCTARASAWSSSSTATRWRPRTWRCMWRR